MRIRSDVQDAYKFVDCPIPTICNMPLPTWILDVLTDMYMQEYITFLCTWSPYLHVCERTLVTLTTSLPEVLTYSTCMQEVITYLCTEISWGPCMQDAITYLCSGSPNLLVCKRTFATCYWKSWPTCVQEYIIFLYTWSTNLLVCKRKLYIILPEVLTYRYARGH